MDFLIDLYLQSPKPYSDFHDIKRLKSSAYMFFWKFCAVNAYQHC